MNLEGVTTCDLCGSAEWTVDEIYRVDGVDFEMRECASCALAWVSPRPCADEMDEWYEGVAHPEWGQSALHVVATPMVRRFLQVSRSLGGRRGVIGSLVPAVERRVWHRLLDRYHLGWASAPCHCLDVGCGNGVWMAAQRRWGFSCEGVEPDQRAAATARALGFKVHAGDLLNAGYSADSCDVVHFNHVLEHVHRPMAVLAEAVRVTRPGGHVLVVVPNHDGVHARACRSVEDVPRHLFAFSGPVLARYFAGVGLQTEYLFSETLDVWALYAPFYHAPHRFAPGDATYARAHDAFWFSKARRREFRKIAGFADATGGGVQVVAIGRKPSRTA